jgi:hypothetical protein
MAQSPPSCENPIPASMRRETVLTRFLLHHHLHLPVGEACVQRLSDDPPQIVREVTDSGVVGHRLTIFCTILVESALSKSRTCRSWCAAGRGGILAARARDLTPPPVEPEVVVYCLLDILRLRPDLLPSPFDLAPQPPPAVSLPHGRGTQATDLRDAQGKRSSQRRRAMGHATIG